MKTKTFLEFCNESSSNDKKLDKIAKKINFEGSDDEISKLLEIARKQKIKDKYIRNWLSNWLGNADEEDLDYWMNEL